MLSPGYEVCLKPDPRARTILLALVAISGATGLLIIASLRPAAMPGSAMVAIWVAAVRMQYCRLQKGFGKLAELQLNDLGLVSIVDHANGRQQANLRTGSRVLPAVAWFRLAMPEGGHLTELMLASSQSERDWRRLQVLWRLGNTFIGAVRLN